MDLILYKYVVNATIVTTTKSYVLENSLSKPGQSEKNFQLTLKEKFELKNRWKITLIWNVPTFLRRLSEI